MMGPAPACPGAPGAPGTASGRDSPWSSSPRGRTSAVLGIGAAVFADATLHDQLLADARRQAEYDLSVLVPDALGGGTDRAASRRLA